MAPSALHNLILVLCVICGVSTVYGNGYVPVYMWGATSKGVPKVNALARLNSDEFRRILVDHLDSEPFTVMFIENNLSYEDLTAKTVEGETVFPGLKDRNRDGSVKFYPFAEPIINTLDAIADPDRVDKVKFTADGLSAEIQPTDGNFLYVSMEDARDGESRGDMLRRHDEFMSELFEKLKTKHDRVLAIYTARNPSWAQPEQEVFEDEVSAVRMKRNLLQAVDLDGSMFFNSSTVLFYVTKITLKQANAEAEELTTTARATSERPSPDEIIFTIPFPTHDVSFSFMSRSGYWYMNTVNVTVDNMTETLTTGRVFAEAGFSYHCSNQVSLAGDNNTLTLFDFQVQANFDETRAAQQFGSAYDCVGFTSVPIWSGLFVVFILLIITFMGIGMMMDIRTMDRFDDPKGKTITINSGE